MFALIIVVGFDIIFRMKSVFSNMMFFAAFFVVCATSCSGGNTVAATEENITLRVTSENRSKETVWMEELEADRLIEKVPHLGNIASNVTLNPQSVSVASASKALYPVIPDFGSLDTSSISYDVRSVVDDFCSSFVSDAPIENYENLMQDDMIFSLVFFLNDISEIIGTDKKNEQVSSNKIKVKQNFFSAYIIGAPFRNEGTYEIPVRFFCDRGTLDCAIFVSSAVENEEPKINQLKIVKINF